MRKQRSARKYVSFLDGLRRFDGGDFDRGFIGWGLGGNLPAIWRWNMIDPWLRTVKADYFFVLPWLNCRKKIIVDQINTSFIIQNKCYLSKRTSSATNTELMVSSSISNPKNPFQLFSGKKNNSLRNSIPDPQKLQNLFNNFCQQHLPYYWLVSTFVIIIKESIFNVDW